MQTVNMNEVVGNCHILFICIDSLRYDVAFEEQQKEGTPTLNAFGPWRKCHAPGNFTYPSHQAMFAGFLPVDEEICDMKNREKLFFSEDIGMGRKAPEHAYTFAGSNWIEGLERIGYDTYCIGGVSFFDKRTDIGKVMPSYFKNSFWNPSFGCKVKDSAKYQVDFAMRRLSEIPDGQLIMMYINFSALHYPNYFYIDNRQHHITSLHYKSNRQHHTAVLHYKDNTQSHAAALRYVDSELKRLFETFRAKGKTFVICCSDHGTCYGEDGIWYHGINHPIVNTVPYKHFFL